MNAANLHLFTDALSAAELMGVGAVRSLDLLRDIDGTITALTHQADLLRAAERAFASVQESIAKGDATSVIPEENVVPVLEALQQNLCDSYPALQAKMKCALDDPRLNDDDGVADAYATLLEAVNSLNDAAERLRWAILESNADVEGDHSPVIMSDTAQINAYLDDL